jgi:hypothetical protein
VTALLAATLPDNSGYVWAAYLILFALVLVYFAIMAAKLSRLERDLIELDELADRRAEQAPSAPAAGDAVAREIQESRL